MNKQRTLPSFADYAGGGIILSPDTPVSTVELYCSEFTPNLLRQARALLRLGYEIMIHRGLIVAAQPADPAQRIVKPSRVKSSRDARDLEKIVASLSDQIRRAIEILDGNADPIDWRDQNQPELLRKLCEHLEAYAEEVMHL